MGFPSFLFKQGPANKRKLKSPPQKLIFELTVPLKKVILVKHTSAPQKFTLLDGLLTQKLKNLR